jgi:hypothetical protein
VCRRRSTIWHQSTRVRCGVHVFARRVTCAPCAALYRGLQQLLSYEGNVADVFDRTFEIEHEAFGVVQKTELKPGGASVQLTNANREEYVA